MAPLTRIAYLGPPGTYGNQAAKLFANSSTEMRQAELVPCATISDIYLDPADYLVMPLQNIIHGAVTDTVDSLLTPLAGPSRPRPRLRGAQAQGDDETFPRIIADLDLPIRHSLVARKGTKMEDIRWVRSHEQALGQSSAFLAQHLPRAKLHPWPSTAGAAMSLLDPGDSADGQGQDGEGLGAGAAICSASAIADTPDLEVIYEGTQAINDNYTRFLLLSRTSSRFPKPTSVGSPSSHFYALSHPSFISRLPVNHIRAIHSRPDPSRTQKERYPYLVLVETTEPAADDAVLAVGGDDGDGEIGGILHLGSAVRVPGE